MTTVYKCNNKKLILTNSVADLDKISVENLCVACINKGFPKLEDAPIDIEVNGQQILLSAFEVNDNNSGSRHENAVYILDLKNSSTETNTPPISVTSDWLTLYSKAIDEHIYYIGRQQTIAAFFFSILSALFGLTIAGIIKSTLWYHFFSLLIGPTLIYIVSEHAIKSTKMVSKRVMEAISIRAKLEQLLGLTIPLNYAEKIKSSVYWKQDSVIPKRHITDRTKSENADIFINSEFNSGYQKSLNIMFCCSIGLSLILFIILAFLSVCTLLNLKSPDITVCCI